MQKFDAKRALALAVFGMLGSEAAWAAHPAKYDQMIPHYLEACALTQYHKKGEAPAGSGGHGVLYVKGLCRDKEAAYPRVKVCDKSVDLSNPEAGVGISVDSLYKNVNWIAVDGREFFLKGDLAEGEVLNEEVLRRAARKAVEKGYFKGVELHDKANGKRPEHVSLTEHAAYESVGTDFAIGYARDIYCSRVPIRPEALPEIAEYLNSLNDKYRDGKKEYHWSGFYDNCTHPVHNALAVAGAWDMKKTRQFVLKQAFHLAVPSNEFIAWAKVGNDGPIGQDQDVYKVFLNDDHRESLLGSDWLPMQPGAVVESIPAVKGDRNQAFEVNGEFFKLEAPGINAKSRDLKKILKEPRYSDLKENLKYHQARYKSAFQNKKPLAWYQARAKKDQRFAQMGSKAFAEFYPKYYSHLSKQLERINAMLLELEKK